MWENQYITEFNIVVYRPLAGSSYIDLPKAWMHPTKRFLNIQNNDDKCFLWCHLAKIFPATHHKERVTKYRDHINKVNYKDITFPVTLRQVPKIEDQNDISFNIFTNEDNEPTKIFPIYVSKKRY